jgi:hypothetical protein
VIKIIRRHQDLAEDRNQGDAMSAWSQWDGPSDYIWVVICKNQEFHSKKNSFSGYKIPLGETDAFENPPDVGHGLKVLCDGCGQENTYLPDDLMRLQMQVAANFKAHPLFG